jgi:hypothetical protein
MLHFVNFKDVISVQSYLKAFPHWTFATVNNHYHDPNDEDDPELYKRVYKNSGGYLEFMRTAEETMDAYNETQPRIELVPRILIPKNNLVHVNYCFSPIEGAGFKGLLFQLMDRSLSDKPLPIFQLEIRDEKLTARWTMIQNGENSGTHIYPFADIVWGGQKWYYIDLYILLSSQKYGEIKVLLDGNKVWELNNAITSTTKGSNVNIQYGIYGSPGMKVRTQVKQLSWDINK